MVAATVVALVVGALLLGVQPDNLHNGLLAVSLAVVGAFVLGRRPEEREARLFLAGRSGRGGRLRRAPGRRRPRLPGPHRAGAVAGLAGDLAAVAGAGPGRRGDHVLPRRPAPGSGVAGGDRGDGAASRACCSRSISALWPVDYGRAGLLVDAPARPAGRRRRRAGCSRWCSRSPTCSSRSGGWPASSPGTPARRVPVARQLRWLVGAVALSLVVLVVGLAGRRLARAPACSRSPLVPLAAGAAMLEASYEALLRRCGPASGWSAPRTRPGAASSATCTTAPSTGWSCWAWSSGAWPTGARRHR